MALVIWLWLKLRLSQGIIWKSKEYHTSYSCVYLDSGTTPLSAIIQLVCLQRTSKYIFFSIFDMKLNVVAANFDHFISWFSERIHIEVASYNYTTVLGEACFHFDRTYVFAFTFACLNIFVIFFLEKKEQWFDIINSVKFWSISVMQCLINILTS